jgi:hypothetical protein
MINISDKIDRENQNSHFCSMTSSENRAVYELRWNNILDRRRPHNMAHGNRMLDNKATNTHSEYVILIPFFH